MLSPKVSTSHHPSPTSRTTRTSAGWPYRSFTPKLPSTVGGVFVQFDVAFPLSIDAALRVVYRSENDWNDIVPLERH